MQRRYLTGLVVVAFVLGLPLAAQAAPVGRFVQVEGSVDVMKGGKSPAVPVKLQDQVEQGDAVRTKSLSRAQIRFVDDTVLTLAPESRVAIDEYVYDAAHSKRQATVEVFRGMVHFLVSKILQTEKPDFTMKTQTGTLGVRGTGWYAMLTPGSTDIYNEHGTTEVQNLFPEIPGKVTLTGMQFTRVGLNLPPTLPLPFTLQDLDGLKMQFKNYTGSSGGGSNTGSPLETGTLGPGGGPGGGIGGPNGGTVSNTIYNPTFSLYTNNTLVNNPLNNPLIAGPTPAPGPISSAYAFTMDLYGYGTNTITSLDNANHTGASWGTLTETGDATEYFTSSGSGTRVSAAFTGSVGTATTFTSSDILSGSVSGVSGQSLTGTFSATWTTSTGYTGTFSGPITINPNGTFSYSYTNLSGSNGTYTITGNGSNNGTPGTYFSETAVGSLAQTGNASGSQQTLTNLNGYSIWGTRTGVYPGTFAATMNMTSTAPESGYYPPADQGSFSATMQGVVSGTGGTQTGVMTTVAVGQNGGSNTFGGPVSINPDGSLSASFYGTNTDNAVTPPPTGTFKQQGTWTQTAQAIPAASTYTFSIPLTDSDVINATSTTQATVGSEGFGLRTGVFPGTYLSYVENGTLTGPSGSFTVGGGSSTSVSGTLTGTVTGVLGGNTLTGTGTFTGTSTTGQTLSYTGPVTINPSGVLTFNYTGSVTQSGQPTLTAAGTMTENFAIALSQSASGTYQAVSGGSNPVLLNTSQMTGSQTVNGGSATATNASLALGYGNGFALPAIATGGTGAFSLSGAGAVSPWYGGQPTYGVLASTLNVDETSSPTVMQVNYTPTTGNITGQVALGLGGSGQFINAVLATTPQSSGLTTRSFYETLYGSFNVNSSSPYRTGTITNSGSWSGNMSLGGSGAVGSYPITANFNLSGTSQAGAFPASDTGSGSMNMMGAVIGPANGTMTGQAYGGLNGANSTVFNIPFSASFGTTNFTINTDPSLPVGSSLPATLTFSQGNNNGSINGYPMTVTGTWNQVDPPAAGTTAATGLTSPAQAGWLQRAAWLASSQAATTGAGANASLLSSRFTRMTGTSLGSRIQGAAQLTQIGTSGNPALAANLQAAWRFRREQQHRQAVLRAAGGAHPRGPGS